MKTLLLFIFMVASQLTFAQGNGHVSVFHRLIVYNSEGEILVVKFKNGDTWVTPGFYQDTVQLIKGGLHEIAATYGITVSDPELKGMFSMRRVRGENREMLLRNIYRCDHLEGELKVPGFLGDAQWMPVDEALKVISFESIRMFIKQTDDHPEVVWGGAIQVKRVNDNRVYEVIEEFYPLAGTSGKKRKKKRKKK